MTAVTAARSGACLTPWQGGRPRSEVGAPRAGHLRSRRKGVTDMATGEENTGDVSGATPDTPVVSPVTRRLDDQIDWYDRKSALNKRWYYRLKVFQILVAAAIPVIQIGVVNDGSAVTELAYVVGAMGALVVVVEGLQQLFQVHNSWTSYRSTCERLKHEKFLYEANAGPYAAAARPDALLAERVEGLVSQEHAAWVSEQHEADQAGSPP